MVMASISICDGISWIESKRPFVISIRGGSRTYHTEDWKLLKQRRVTVFFNDNQGSGKCRILFRPTQQIHSVDYGLCICKCKSKNNITMSAK